MREEIILCFILSTVWALSNNFKINEKKKATSQFVVVGVFTKIFLCVPHWYVTVGFLKDTALNL